MGRPPWPLSSRLPEALGTILEIGADYVLTDWRDDFDVPYLRMYRIVKGGG